MRHGFLFATIITGLALTASSDAASSYHQVSVSGVVNVEEQDFTSNGSFIFPIHVTNAFILKEFIANSGQATGLKVKDLDIVINDATGDLDIINKSVNPIVAFSPPLASNEGGETFTTPVVATSSKSMAETFVGSGYSFDIVGFQGSADVLYHEVFDVTGTILKSATFNLFGGGSTFYFVGTIKTTAKTYVF